jgi:hypothetical protein
MFNKCCIHIYLLYVNYKNFIVDNNFLVLHSLNLTTLMMIYNLEMNSDISVMT